MAREGGDKIEATLTGPFGRSDELYSLSVALSDQDYAALAGTEISNIDTDSDASYYYFGKAAPGSSNASAVWRISRMSKSSPYLTRFAGGAATYANVWNDRASLTYA